MTMPSDVPQIAIRKVIQSESSNLGTASRLSGHICPNNRASRGPPSMSVSRSKLMALKEVMSSARPATPKTKVVELKVGRREGVLVIVLVSVNALQFFGRFRIGVTIQLDAAVANTENSIRIAHGMRQVMGYEDQCRVLLDHQAGE